MGHAWARRMRTEQGGLGCLVTLRAQLHVLYVKKFTGNAEAGCAASMVVDPAGNAESGEGPGDDAESAVLVPIGVGLAGNVAVTGAGPAGNTKVDPASEAGSGPAGNAESAYAEQAEVDNVKVAGNARLTEVRSAGNADAGGVRGSKVTPAGYAG